MWFKIQHLKSVHFKNLDSFKIVVLSIQNQNKKYHNFERIEIRATVFLKWTDFRCCILNYTLYYLAHPFSIERTFFYFRVKKRYFFIWLILIKVDTVFYILFWHRILTKLATVFHFLFWRKSLVVFLLFFYAAFI